MAADPKMIEQAKKLADDMLGRKEINSIQADVIKVQLARLQNRNIDSDFVE